MQLWLVGAAALEVWVGRKASVHLSACHRMPSSGWTWLLQLLSWRQASCSRVQGAAVAAQALVTLLADPQPSITSQHPSSTHGN